MGDQPRSNDEMPTGDDHSGHSDLGDHLQGETPFIEPNSDTKKPLSENQNSLPTANTTRSDRSDKTTRSWRHPSEISAINMDLETHEYLENAGNALIQSHRFTSRRKMKILVGALGTLAVGLALGSLIAPSSRKSTHQNVNAVSTLIIGATKNGSRSRLIENINDSIVSLDVQTDHQDSLASGVVMGPHLVVTTMDAVKTAQLLTVQTMSGQSAGGLVIGEDERSDVAIVAVTPSLVLRPANFAETSFVTRMNTMIAFGIVPTPKKPLAPTIKESDVSSMSYSEAQIATVGAGIQSGTAHGFAGIWVKNASLPNISGESLINSRGKVFGILDSSSSDAATPQYRAFLPISVVINIAKEMLFQNNVLVHGSMSITGWMPKTTLPTTPQTQQNAPTTGTSNTEDYTATLQPTGVHVSWVSSYGASAGLLHSGEMIETINATPVSTMAELRSIVYSEIPGTILPLVVRTNGQTFVVDITLGPAS